MAGYLTLLLITFQKGSVWLFVAVIPGIFVSVWITRRVSWFVLRWVAPVECPECGGKARVDRVTSDGRSWAFALRCHDCGDAWEEFGGWSGDNSSGPVA